MNVVIDSVKKWFWEIGEQNIPPLLLERVLRDGTGYYVQAVLFKVDTTKSMVVCVWDLQALSPDDLEDLKRMVNDQIKSGRPRAYPDHPKLDVGNLRIYLDDVWYCIEWHHRLWPKELKKAIGFHADTKAEPESPGYGSQTRRT